ncbi:ERO1-like protein beta isoform X1 [Lates japonicus]|uniref:ERO1-like protein beta isoform X1 n=1 Tax=Lates japonicus TaxID=270547 RepID=A0AAD3NLJ8_LATJO|nr:ERO1-like protein beta isoform X1 [Lates japonicus]
MWRVTLQAFGVLLLAWFFGNFVLGWFQHNNVKPQTQHSEHPSGASDPDQSCLCHLTGVLDDCFCDVESIDVFNNFKIYPRIKKLTERDYFRYYRVNLRRPTPRPLNTMSDAAECEQAKELGAINSTLSEGVRDWRQLRTISVSWMISVSDAESWICCQIGGDSLDIRSFSLEAQMYRPLNPLAPSREGWGRFQSGARHPGVSQRFDPPRRMGEGYNAAPEEPQHFLYLIDARLLLWRLRLTQLANLGTLETLEDGYQRPAMQLSMRSSCPPVYTQLHNFRLLLKENRLSVRQADTQSQSTSDWQEMLEKTHI